MASEETQLTKSRSSGLVFFVLGGLAFSIVLISQITEQTEWSDRARNIASQPRLWPAIALIVMLGGFAVQFLRLRRRWPLRADRIEARRWLEPFEFLIWFMAYVMAVPILGFLPMSVVFACALTWRLGYRDRTTLWIAAGFAVAMVLLFKGFLGVNIPGAAIYEVLPSGLRSFFLTTL